METRSKIVLAGKAEAEIASLAEILSSSPAWSVSVHASVTGTNSHALDDAEVLVLCLPEGDGEELRALAELSPTSRPPLLIVGKIEDTAMTRLAMQAGARDFLMPPVSAGELCQALERIRIERRNGKGGEEGRLIAFINGKGGSGASILASNIAHILAVLGTEPAALIDGDLQFGALPQYFDLNAKDGLRKAILSADELDGLALEGYMLKHKSGLHLLSSSYDSLVLYGAEEIPEADMRLKKLLGLLKRQYAQLVVDLPRQIDRMTGTVLQQANDVVVVMQQSLVQIRDVQRLMVFLRELAVQPDKIHVVINRFDKTMPVSPADIERALHQPCFAILPNDFQVVSQSANLGIPLYEFKHAAPITKALTELAGKLSARPLIRPKGGLFGWLKG